MANKKTEGLFCENKNLFTVHVCTFLRQEVQLLLQIKSLAIGNITCKSVPFSLEIPGVEELSELWGSDLPDRKN